MQMKADVDARFLRQEIVKYLFNIEAIFRFRRDDAGYQLVVTSAADGTHREDSKHYENKAVDFRIWGFTAGKLEEIKYDIHALVGNDYQVKIEATHIHFEFDP